MCVCMYVCVRVCACACMCVFVSEYCVRRSGPTQPWVFQVSTTFYYVDITPLNQPLASWEVEGGGVGGALSMSESLPRSKLS